MNHRLKDKNILITGASGGIGEKIALYVAELGANPILLARSEDKLEQIAHKIEETYGRRCLFMKLDVSDAKQLEEVFSAIKKQVSTIDVLVNNAGFGIFDTVLDANLVHMKSMFEVNVFGVIASTKLILPTMLESGTGHIVNIASIAGKIATPKSSVYSASKHAVLGFTNSLRMELAHTNIYVTAVNPGPIQTNFFSIADESGNYEKNVSRYMLDPNIVAKKVVNLMLTPKRELNLPIWMGIGSKLYNLVPGLVEKIGGNMMFKK